MLSAQGNDEVIYSYYVSLIINIFIGNVVYVIRVRFLVFA